MYDLAEIRESTDRLWVAVRDGLRADGVAAPDRLSRPIESYVDHWLDSNLLLSQTCGYPLVRDLEGEVAVLGSFATEVDEPDHPGWYRSVIVCRSDDPRAVDPRAEGGNETIGADPLVGFRTVSPAAPLLVAINGTDSLSGFVSLGSAWRGGIDVDPIGAALVTGSHVASLEALQTNRADLASIDSWTYYLLGRHRPSAVSGLRVIARGPLVAATPLITSAGGPVAALRRAVDNATKELRATDIGIVSFVPHDIEPHEPVVDLARDALDAFDSALLIRSARHDDYPFLGPIDLASNRLFIERGHPEFETDESIPEDAARAAVEEGRLFVTEVLDRKGSSRLVGWVYLTRISGELSIGQISMHPDVAKRGYGSTLLNSVIRHARVSGEPTLILNTQADIPWNRPWYEKFGFQVVEPNDWTEGMRECTADQTEAGLDWSTRVHMRLSLGGLGPVG